MKRLKENKHMLYVLKAADPKLRAAILKNVNPEVIRTICDISHNTLNGNNKICNYAKGKLKKYKRQLRKLTCSKETIASKRKILVQKGGFLPALIGSVLSGVIGAYLNS
jgi:hypothetical protein